MLTTNKQLSYQFATKTMMAVLSWSLIGAMIVAMGAGIFGLLYGILSSLLHVGAWPVSSVACYFAICGAVSGALVGGFAKTVDASSIDGSPRGAVGVRDTENYRNAAEIRTKRQAQHKAKERTS